MKTTFKVPVAESKPDPGYSIESPFAAGSALSAPKREFASLALAMRHASMRVSPTSQSGDGSSDDDGRRSMASQWQAAADKATAHAAARRIRWNNKVRSLQRTPLHMVIHRMRQLVEKRESLLDCQGQAEGPASTARRPGSSMSDSRPSPKSPVPKRGNMFSPRAQSGKKPSPRATTGTGKSQAATTAGAGLLMDEESILDEMCVTARFLAEFMSRLPEDVCSELCRHVFVETAGKDQVIARPGDEVSKFTIIVTGIVERAETLRTEGRFTQSSCINLKKGSHFGADLILKKEKHKYAYSALGSVTMLVIDKEPFRHIYGLYFADRTRKIGAFLHTRVAAFRGLDTDTAQMLAEMTEEVKLELGTEFDIYNNECVYILGDKARVNLLIPKLSSLKEKGKASRRSSKARRETMFKVLHLDDEMDENGKYINITPDNMPLDVEVGEQMVTVHQGMAYSTFGTAMKHSMADTEENFQVIAQLERGTYFGGGTFIQGEDPLVADIKALVVADSVCFRISRDALRHRVPEEIVQLLRNETAFQLTYYMGRQGVMAEGHVLGHVEASIFDSRTRNSMHAQRTGSTMSDAMRTFHTQSSVSKSRKQMSAFQAKRKALMATKAEYMRKANEKLPKKEAEAKFVNIKYKEAKYPVGSIMKYKTDTEQEHNEAMGQSILTAKGTPVERYWNSSGSNTVQQTKMLPVLQTVFPMGLQPLADKVIRMADLERRREEAGLIPPSHAGAAWGDEGRDSEDENSDMELSRTIQDLDSTRGDDSAAVSSSRQFKGGRKSKLPARQDPLAPPTPDPAPESGLSARRQSGSPRPLPPRPQTSPALPSADCRLVSSNSAGLRGANGAGGVESVRAASYLWEGMKGHRRPHIRQCLTFAEIAKFRGEDRQQTQEIVKQRSKHDPEIKELTDWHLSKLLNYNPYGDYNRRPATSGGDYRARRTSDD